MSPSSKPAVHTLDDAAAAVAATEVELRMRDLVSRSGLTRETIHFYIAQGLLPKPLKTGRNTAVYGEEHLERLQRIRELQERHFLPLRAIRAVLEETVADGFTGEQEALLRRVRESLPAGRAPIASGEVELARLVPSRVSRADVDAMKRLGLIEVRGRGASANVSIDDARILECWADLRALEQPGEPLFTPDLLGIYDDAIEGLVAREARILTERYSAMSGERAIDLIENTEPLIERLVAVLRRKKIAALIHGATPPPPKS